MKTKKPRFAAKILALVLSLLMLLGAMPVAFAAEGDIVVKWPTAAKEIEYGQTVADAGLNDDGEAKIGDSLVDGHFEYTYPTDTPGVGVSARDAKFIPDDTNIAPVDGFIDVKVNQSKSATLEGGVPTASSINAGQKLSDSVITKTGIKLMNYGKSFTWKCEWKEPDKAMDTAGTFTEVVICKPLTSTNQKKIAPIEVEIEVTVISAEDVIEIANFPTASEVYEGQTLADSALTGGVVTKGGNPIDGTFTWKESDTVLKMYYETQKFTVVFTPADSAVCEPIEMEIPVVVNLVPIEITEWPTAISEYVPGGYIRDYVTLEGGKANFDGKFINNTTTYVDCDAKIPADLKISDTFEIEVMFKPTDTRYEPIIKTVTVTFETAAPDCIMGYIEREGGSVEMSGHLRNTATWDQHTGKFNYVLDGVSTEIDGTDTETYKYSCNNLAVGTHTAYCEYIPGENDVYAYGKSNEIVFDIIGYYDVIVTDCTGTYVDGNYRAGQRIDAHAAPHENAYYEFSGWTVEGTEITEHSGLENGTLYFTMPEGEVHLTANYKFNFKLFLEDSFTKVIVWLKDIVTQGIEWIKGLLP